MEEILRWRRHRGAGPGAPGRTSVTSGDLKRAFNNHKVTWLLGGSDKALELALQALISGGRSGARTGATCRHGRQHSAAPAGGVRGYFLLGELVLIKAASILRPGVMPCFARGWAGCANATAAVLHPIRDSWRTTSKVHYLMFSTLFFAGDMQLSVAR